jgi:DNA polymerase delta subunit 1
MVRTLPLACGGTMQTHKLVSPSAAPAARLQPRLRAVQTRSRRTAVCVRAAMAGMAGAGGDAPDPYQVLGLSPGASHQDIDRSYKRMLNDAKGDKERVDIIEAAHRNIFAPDPYQTLGLSANATSEMVQRSYRRALNDAKGDKSRVEKIEAAHTSIMMSGLTERMKGRTAGGTSVPKEVKYADRAVYFPWRPRKFVAEARFIQIVGAVQLLLAAWALLSSVSAGTQPLGATALSGVVANVYKQNMINPAPSSSGGENKNQTFKNLFRGALLTLMATFLGAFLFFTLPDFLKNTVTRSPMPTWFYQSESTLLCVGATLFNFIFSAFLR